MSFLLEINDVDYTCNIFRNTFSIRESLQSNGASMGGRIQLSGSLTSPLAGQTVRFYRDGVLEFAGRISSTRQNYDYFVNQWDIECQDWTPDLDAELLKTEYEGGSISDVVVIILGQLGRGFTGNNIASAPNTLAFDADYEQASSIISRLAESVEYQWYLDYERDLHFFYVRDRPAPVTSIDFDADTDGRYSDLIIAEDASQVKNVIYLKGAQIKSPYRDSKGWQADGDTRFFPLSYQPVSAKPVDITVQVDGAYKTLRLDSVEGEAGDGASSETDVYVCVENWGIRFPDASPPPEDASVSVSYRYVINPVVVVEDQTAIAFMREREHTTTAESSGRHESVFQVPELGVLDSEQVIVDYGNLLLARYAYPVYLLTFSSLTQGWKVGQSFEGVSIVRGFSARCYVTSVSKQIYQSSSGVAMFKYEIEASTSPFPI